MKTKTRKLIAAITATALLGTTVGIGIYALNNSSNNNFGFRGTYSLNALAAEQAAPSTVTVAGATVDVTTTLTLTSNNKDYTLFVSVVDTGDMSALVDINVGYTIGTNVYNGKASGLSKVVYSSLTVNTGVEATPTATVTAAELAKGFTAITEGKAMLVIAEVEGVIAETPTLTIEAKQSASNISETITGIGAMTNSGNTSITDATGSNTINYTGVTSNGKTNYYAYLGESVSPFYVNKAKTVYFEGTEADSFRIDNASTKYIQTTGPNVPLYLDLTSYEPDVDVKLVIKACSTGSGNLNRYIIIEGNDQTINSAPVGGSGVTDTESFTFIIKSGYKYNIDNSNGLRFYSIQFSKATETDKADVLTPVTVTVKDKSGNIITTISADTNIEGRPELYVGSALTSAGATSAIQAGVDAKSASWDGKIYTDAACSKAYSQTTRLTGDTTLYVDVAYPTQVAINYNSTEYPITKTIGSELTLDEVITALGITVADNQKLVCKVNGEEVTLPIEVVAGLTIDAELVTAKTIVITNADGSGDFGEVKLTVDTTMTYAELAACVTRNIPSGMVLSAIYVDGHEYTSTSGVISVKTTSTITATFTEQTANIQTIGFTTASDAVLTKIKDTINSTTYDEYGVISFAYDSSKVSSFAVKTENGDTHIDFGGALKSSSRYIKIDLSKYTGTAKVSFTVYSGSDGRSMYLATKYAVSSTTAAEVLAGSVATAAAGGTASITDYVLNCGSVYYICTDSTVKLSALTVTLDVNATKS